jgi:hypothetical protein
MLSARSTAGLKRHRRPGVHCFRSAAALALVTAALLTQACDGSREIEIAANEAAAVKSLQMIAVYQRLYNKMHSGNAYGTFDQLTTEVNLDKRFVGDAPVVSGYIFTMKITPRVGGEPAFFSVNADPMDELSTAGRKHYYVDAKSDTVKVNEQRPAGPSDPSVEQ